MSNTQLPDDQQPDGELDGTEMVAYDRAKELSAQFDEIQTATIGDGLVQGAVEAIEASPNNGAISVEVDVPAEPEPVQFFLDKPKSWNRDYDFVRWVEDHGYDAGDFEDMIERRVRVQVRREDDEYELVIPERGRDHSRKLKPAMKQYAASFGNLLRNHEIAAAIIVGLAGIFIGNAMAASMMLSGNAIAFSIVASILTTIIVALAFVVAVVLAA